MTMAVKWIFFLLKCCFLFEKKVLHRPHLLNFPNFELGQLLRFWPKSQPQPFATRLLIKKQCLERNIDDPRPFPTALLFVRTRKKEKKRKEKKSPPPTTSPKKEKIHSPVTIKSTSLNWSQVKFKVSDRKECFEERSLMSFLIRVKLMLH